MSSILRKNKELKTNYLKTGILFIILVCGTIYTPSLYQKGGVEPLYQKIIPLIVLVCGVVYIFPIPNLNLTERIILPLLISFITLFLVSIIICPSFVSSVYAGKTWFLWETTGRILTNTIYYGSSLILILSLLQWYQKGKKSRFAALVSEIPSIILVWLITFCVTSFISVMISLLYQSGGVSNKPVTNIGFPFNYYYQFWLRGSDSPNCGWQFDNFLLDISITGLVVIPIHLFLKTKKNYR